jgi:hypothetical protein
VADPDGRIRTVIYSADPVNGFQARVTYDGAAGPVAIPVESTPGKATVIFSPPAAVAALPAEDSDVPAAITVARKPPAGLNTPSVAPSSITQPVSTIFRQAPPPSLRHVFRQPLIPAPGPLLDFSQFRFLPAESPAAFAGPAVIPALGLHTFGPPAAAAGGLDLSQFRFVSAGNVV